MMPPLSLRLWLSHPSLPSPLRNKIITRNPLRMTYMKNPQNPHNLRKKLRHSKTRELYFSIRASVLVPCMITKRVSNEI